MSVALACCPLAWRCRAGCAELGCSPSRSSCCRSNPASAGASPGSCGARKAGWVQRGVQWRTSPLGQCAVDCGRPTPRFVGPPARQLIHLPLRLPSAGSRSARRCIACCCWCRRPFVPDLSAKGGGETSGMHALYIVCSGSGSFGKLGWCPAGCCTLSAWRTRVQDGLVQRACKQMEASISINVNSECAVSECHCQHNQLGRKFGSSRLTCVRPQREGPRREGPRRERWGAEGTLL